MKWSKKEIVALVEDTLEALFPHPAIPLTHTSPYTLLIAVLLSAQCTDARVNQVTPRLFALADTPEAMAQLEPAALEEVIRPCGLFKAKSKAIVALSKLLVEKHQGQVPKNMAALEALPGVGHKTASVVMAQAFHEPTFPVDTHIHRCAERWGLSSGKNVVLTETDLKRAFPRSTWNRRHLQILYFARAYCPARGHKISACPICSKLTEAKAR
jgi:endonuclease-3